MRVNGIENQIAYKRNLTNSPNQDEKFPRVKNFLQKRKTYIEAGLTSLVIGGIYWAYNYKKCRSINALNKSNNLNNQVITYIKNLMKQFPKDIDYRKDIIKGIEGNPENYYQLRSIMGPEEYKKILIDFSDSPEHYSPGASLITEIKDGYDMSGKISKKYRASLHNHTTHSDGRMSIKEILDQAAEYADDIVRTTSKTPDLKAPHAPFTIAITDHDTLEGCKEAVKIINSDPLKYRNLRVVLGCELSVESQLIERELKSPISLHLLLHGINPFDKKLNEFLASKKQERIALIKDIIQKSANELKTNYPQSAQKLSYEDAGLLCAPLEKGILHVNNLTKDYIQFRTIFSELFEQNQEIQRLLKEKGIDPKTINYIQNKEKYMNGFEFSQQPHWEIYYETLCKYISELLGIKEEEAVGKMQMPTELKSVFEKINTISKNESPKLELQPAYIDMKEIIQIMKEQPYGYMGIAHPGLINLGRALKYPEESIPSLNNFFKKFKEEGGDKALFVELYYHYFGEVGKSEYWLNKINNYAKQNGLHPSGGLDSHGKSIFYSDT